MARRGWVICDAVCEQRDDSPMGVQRADSPWSVPRLRGRGSRGHRDAETPFRQGLNWRSLSFHTFKSAVKRVASPPVSLADHGLASEARSTACALC